MATLSVNTSFNISLQFSSAPFHIRFFAWIIDLVIIIAYQWAAMWAMNAAFGYAAKEAGFDILIYIPVFCYYLLF